jgi:hypothetical protein
VRCRKHDKKIADDADLESWWNRPCSVKSDFCECMICETICWAPECMEDLEHECRNETTNFGSAR